MNPGLYLIIDILYGSIFVKGGKSCHIEIDCSHFSISGEIYIFIYLLLLEDNNLKNLRRKFVLRSVDLEITEVNLSGKVQICMSHAKKIKLIIFFQL